MQVSVMRHVQVVGYENAQEKEQLAETQQDRNGLGRVESIDDEYETTLEAIDEGNTALKKEVVGQVAGGVGFAVIGGVIGGLVAFPVGIFVGVAIGAVFGPQAGGAMGKSAGIANRDRRSDLETEAGFDGMNLTANIEGVEDAQNAADDAKVFEKSVQRLRELLSAMDVRTASQNERKEER